MSDQLRLPEQDELAADIRRAFSAYRAPLRDPLAVRVQPAPDRRPRLLAASAAAGVVVLLVAAALLAQSLARPTSAYATWTAVPTSPDPALAVAADDQCRNGLAPGDPALPPLVALDQRGLVAMALFSDGRSYATCMVVRGVNGGATAIGRGTIEAPRAGAARVLGGIAHEGEPPLRMLVGDLSPDVVGVSIEREDGTSVAATVTDGWFLAWWPTDAGVTSMTAYDTAGEALDTLAGDPFD